MGVGLLNSVSYRYDGQGLAVLTWRPLAAFISTHGEKRWTPGREAYLAYDHVSSGRFTTIGVGVLLTTTQ